jgi:hypothetical protein
MFVDNSLSFNGGWTTPQAITATANGSSIIDITGAGSGNAPAMIGGFPATKNAIGNDYGLADGEAVPYLYLTVTTAGTGAGTLTVSIQEAPDNGSYSPGTYTTVYTSTTFVGTTLTLGTVLLVPLPPRIPGTLPPRFYQVVYTVASTLTASVLAGLVINPPSSLTGQAYPRNFVG